MTWAKHKVHSGVDRILTPDCPLCKFSLIEEVKPMKVNND